MFMFSHYTLNAFSPRIFLRYKRHAGMMAALLFICGACCLAWPLVAGWYLAVVTGMLLMICGFYSLYSLIVFRQQHWKSQKKPRRGTGSGKKGNDHLALTRHHPQQGIIFPPVMMDQRGKGMQANDEVPGVG